MDLRVATFNISGGEKTFEESPHNSRKSRQQAMEKLIGRLDATVLCLQEVSQYIDADGVTHSLMDDINKAGGFDYSFYGKTVSMDTDMHVKKEVMVKGIFNDWWNWSKGNAIHTRIPFGRLSDPRRPGVPRNILLFQSIAYEGTRDTEPRSALLARFKEPPHPYIATLHLSTLVGERPPQNRPGKVEESQLLRHQQVQRFLDLVGKHILKEEEPLILAGDFNATQDELCIGHLLESENGFVRLIPENEGPTHTVAEKPIDHIFFYPRKRLLDYSCWIETGNLSRRASDHLPVVADLKIK